MSTWTDVLTDAYGEIGVARAGDALAPELLDLGLRTLNRLFDQWNAKRAAVWTDSFQDFIITPNLAVHTIGLVANAPTWTVAGNRPEKIISARLILTDVTPHVNVPIAVRDSAWWNAQRVPSITSTLPTDLYYSPDWPNGSCYLWPVPVTAYTVELLLRVVLSQVAAGDTVSLPPGYDVAIMLTTSERLAAAMGQVASPATVQAAREARAIIFDAHDEPPRIRTRDAGMPRGGRSRTTFNYKSRSFR